MNAPQQHDRDGNVVTIEDNLALSEYSIDDVVLMDIERKILRTKLTVLNPREKEIISMRYGLGCEPLTQREVGDKLGISRSYVSRIEKRALKKLFDSLKGLVR